MNLRKRQSPLQTLFFEMEGQLQGLQELTSSQNTRKAASLQWIADSPSRFLHDLIFTGEHRIRSQSLCSRAYHFQHTYPFWGRFKCVCDVLLGEGHCRRSHARYW